MKYIIYIALYTFVIHSLSVVGTRYEARDKLYDFCALEMKSDRSRDECRSMMFNALDK